MRHVLVTGGAGFVGANLAIAFKRFYPELTVSALDSLKRRGGELNLPRLRAAGVRFYHGDIRCEEDLEALPDLWLSPCATSIAIFAQCRPLTM